MSAYGAEMDVLLDAVRDRLRAALSLSENECDVTPDGMPNPNAGQRFVFALAVVCVLVHVALLVECKKGRS